MHKTKYPLYKNAPFEKVRCG